MSFEFGALIYGSSHCSACISSIQALTISKIKFINCLAFIHSHPLIIIISWTFFTIHCSLFILKHFQVSRWADELCLNFSLMRMAFFPNFSEIIENNQRLSTRRNVTRKQKIVKESHWTHIARIARRCFVTLKKQKIKINSNNFMFI